MAVIQRGEILARHPAAGDPRAPGSIWEATVPREKAQAVRRCTDSLFTCVRRADATAP